ncbi:MAG TPA: bifunctional diaminohydroxyphosphoribosylaminopyrimidine deaminase/5-amino-6-(5-phosphoribosylamino)uracil reductase RibD [Gemmatimonadales bacterium]|nr:bifunctional diaminohydroxyphosphoribosylaminopyrimidine deaminase/5-amino-6-(5-phosphoribosylamino)uracil reductase RibD [Gemmatimonadales bacterium]
MIRALDLAWRGWGRVQPNPLVGAVVLSSDGRVVGEGWHAEFGDRHAEPVALESAGERARGGTLVATLEPCNHQGKQPPCTDAVLSSGVRRVVVAMPDPNPEASGGAAKLAAEGVEVRIGLERGAAEAQNAIFLHRFRDAGRPFVALKLATSLDGRIADAAGQSRWISGDKAREYVHWLRAGFDAIAVGGRTARQDDPQLTARGGVEPRTSPRRVVFDTKAELSTDLALVRTAAEVETIVVASPEAPTGNLRRLEMAGVTVLRAGSLEEALGQLRGAGIGSVLVEGGGKLAGALLAGALVDRYYWVQSPLWLGERGIPAHADVPSEPIAAVERWTVVERRALGEDTLLVVDRR